MRPKRPLPQVRDYTRGFGYTREWRRRHAALAWLPRCESLLEKGLLARWQPIRH